MRRYGRHPSITLGDTFHDRRDEQHAIRTALADRRTRMVSVLGRGGMGKTALACRGLASLEREEPADPLDPRVAGIAYLHHTPTHPITLDRTLLYIAKVLPDDLAEKAERVFGNRDRPWLEVRKWEQPRCRPSYDNFSRLISGRKRRLAVEESAWPRARHTTAERPGSRVHAIRRLAPGL